MALIGLCIVQHQQIQELRAERALPKVVVKPAVATAVDGTGTVAQKHRVKETPPVVAEKNNDEKTIPQPKTRSAKPNATPEESKSASVSSNESPLAGIAKMMKSPGMKDIMRAQQKGQMDLSHASLFKYLQLPEADLETFKNIMMDKKMTLMDISLEMLDNNATPEEKKAAAERLKKTTDDYDARIKELLGDDNFAVYKSFEETQPERMQVTLLKGSLRSDDQLTEEQEDSLIRAMHDQRTNFHYSVAGFNDKDKMPDASMFTPDRMAKLLEESAKLQEQYAAAAAGILTPNQLEQFKASQKQQQAMQEMGIKMAAKMFGQQSKEKAAESP